MIVKTYGKWLPEEQPDASHKAKAIFVTDL